MSKIFKPFIKLFTLIYKIIDKLIVTPISRLIYKISEFNKENQSKFERILNRPNILIYISLIAALALFFLVNKKVINLTEKNAEVLEGQEVKVVYNAESYVVKGVPESVDITLIGDKSSLYLATQLGDHSVELDLSDYGPGTYKVKLKYNHSINSVSYKIDPSVVTVTISEKVSETRSLTYDLLNENKMSEKSSISSVELDTNEVVVKSSQEILDNVAVVKALVDASSKSIDAESGEFTLEDVKLVAFDSSGNRLDDVEIVPSSVKAKVVVDSYHAVKPVKIITDGDMPTGKAIESITSSVKEVTVYGDKEKVDSISYIPATINVSKIDSNKTVAVTLTKPDGVRYMTDTSTSVNITVGEAVQKTITGIVVHTEGLSDEYLANAVSSEDSTIDVIVTGVQSLIDSDVVDAQNIHATVDLSKCKVGTNEVDVEVTIDDERINVKSTKTKINVKLVQK